MNEILIITALIPMAILVANESPTVMKFCLGFSYSILISCFAFVAFQAYSAHSNPLALFTPVGMLVFCVAYEQVKNRSIRPLAVLAYGFLCQSLVTEKVSVAVLLLVLADAMFGAQAFLASSSEKDRKQVVGVLVAALLTYMPAVASILLDLDPELRTWFFLASLLLRLASWPIPFWGQSLVEKRIALEVALSAVPAYVLWKITLQSGDYWAMAWFCVAALLSLGATLRTVCFALSLGFVALFPALSFMASALWALYLLEGASVYFLVLILLSLGAAVAPALSLNVVPEVATSMSVLAGVLCARLAVQIKERKASWIDLSLVVAFVTPSLIQLGIGGFPEIKLNPDSGAFVGAFALTAILLLLIKKPRFVVPLPGTAVFSKLASRFGKTEAFEGLTAEGVLGAGAIFQYPRLKKIFHNFESEGAMVTLIGISATILIWLLW